MSILRRVISINKLRWRGFHVALRCGHLLVLAQSPTANKLRCQACEHDLEDYLDSGMTETKAIAALDSAYQIPRAERGKYHISR